MRDFVRLQRVVEEIVLEGEILKPVVADWDSMLAGRNNQVEQFRGEDDEKQNAWKLYRQW